MAYVPFQDEEQNKQNVAATPEIGSSSALPTTGGGGAGAAPSNITGNPGAQPSQPGKQGFANLNQYLAANKDQAAGVAGSVASNLNTQYAGLKGDIDTAANQAGEAVKGGSTAYDPNLVNSALSDPTQFVGNPENLANWQKQYSAAYTGPTAFENTAGYGKAATAANKAGQTAQLGTTGGGYTQLLNQVEKNPTAGKTALDKSLIQYDPNASQTVQTALNSFKGIGDYLKGKSIDIGQQATDAAKTTNTASTKTKEALTGATSNLANQVNQQYQTGLANQQTYNQQANDLKKMYQPYDELINSYKLATERDFGDPFESYKKYQPDQLQLTPEQLASKSQFANEAALEQLGGQPLNILSNQNQPNYNTSQTPGQYPTLPGFDANQLNFTYSNAPESELSKLNPETQWYTKALTDAAQKTGWKPGTISPEQWLSGTPVEGMGGQNHPNDKFSELQKALTTQKVSDYLKSIGKTLS